MAVVSSASEGLRLIPSPHRGEGQGEGLKLAPTILQLRAPGLSASAFEREANELVNATTVPVLISSRCDVALATGAAGVNLPESDIAAVDARKLLGKRLVGRSVHSIKAAQEAERDGADFVIFGPVWESTSHPGSPPAGVAALELVVRSIRIPVLAIGGVTIERIAECRAAGAAGYAAIGMFK
jgi:thiamine-phosphate pyrophosphorylase